MSPQLQSAYFAGGRLGYSPREVDDLPQETVQDLAYLLEVE